MAVATIPHKPALTKEHVLDTFRKQFGGKYKVDATQLPMRDFIIEKSAFVGVGVKLQQDASETKIVYSGLAPRWWARVILGASSRPDRFLLFLNGLTPRS